MQYTTYAWHDSALWERSRVESPLLSWWMTRNCLSELMGSKDFESILSFLYTRITEKVEGCLIQQIGNAAAWRNVKLVSSTDINGVLNRVHMIHSPLRRAVKYPHTRPSISARISAEYPKNSRSSTPCVGWVSDAICASRLSSLCHDPMKMPCK